MEQPPKDTDTKAETVTLPYQRHGVAARLSPPRAPFPGVWHGVHYPGWLPPALTFVCGFFSALCAAMAGIANQGEFRRLAKRSEDMREQLEIMSSNIAALQQEMDEYTAGSSDLYSPRVAKLASDAARLLVNEVLDWRVATSAKSGYPEADLATYLNSITGCLIAARDRGAV